MSWGRFFQSVKVSESAKAVGFAVEALDFEHACV